VLRMQTMVSVELSDGSPMEQAAQKLSVIVGCHVYRTYCLLRYFKEPVHFCRPLVWMFVASASIVVSCSATVFFLDGRPDVPVGV
jgi:hypothetical protein